MKITTDYEIVDLSADKARLNILVSVNGDEAIKHVYLSGFSRDVIEQFVSGVLELDDLNIIYGAGQD